MPDPSKQELSSFASSLPLKPGVEVRDYQLLAAFNALKHGNTLVVMPTAMGKTFIALMVMAAKLKEGRKMMFMAPTKPLAAQQAKRIQELLLTEEKAVLVSGEVAPEKRIELYSSSKIICSTPQTIENDVLTRRLNLNDFSLIVFDEVHKAVGDYAYVFIAEKAKETSALLLGLTASPSSQKEKVEEICSHLGAKHIEIQVHGSKELREYAKQVRVDWDFVELPGEFSEINGLFKEMLKECLVQLKDLGFLESSDFRKTGKRELLEVRAKALAKMIDSPSSFSALSLQAKSLNLVLAIDYLENQGLHALLSFFSEMGLREKKSKAVKELLADFRTKKALALAEKLVSIGVEHPKMEKLKKLVSLEVATGKSVIVFAHYRSSSEKIASELNKLAGIRARLLVGRSKEGMNQKQQIQTLQDFREGLFNVLVCTQVGEEGLDIPSVELVVFYESVPSEVRSIQRRGRTGRIRAGHAIVLITRGTRDESYFWIAKKKERKMNELLSEMRDGLQSKFRGDERAGGKKAEAANQKKIGEY